MKAKKNGVKSKPTSSVENKAKNGPPKVTEKSANGNSSSPSSSSHQLMPAVVVLLSLIAGILTPPIATYFEASHPLGGQNAIQRWMAGTHFSGCTEEALSQFLHDEAVEGLHVICFGQQEEKKVVMTLYPGAHRDSSGPLEVTVDATAQESQVLQWAHVQKSLRNYLNLRSADDLHQPWAVFSPVGERIVEEDEVWDNEGEHMRVLLSLSKSGLVLLFEGGKWLWPGVREGFKRNVDLYSVIPGDAPESAHSNKTRTVVLETLSLEPLIVSVEGFLSPTECSHVQTTAEPIMEYSPVVLMDKDRGKDSTEWRTSQSAFVPGQDDIFLDLEYRTASLVRIPKDHQEDLQVLRYGLNERYLAHTDYFDPEFYQKDEGTLDMIGYGRRNRLATVFWYLSDVEVGGETAFPRARGHETSKDCEEGLLVKPQRGKVIIFYSLTASGRMDILSTHAACPVKEGIKWAANKWVWNEGFDDDDEDEDGIRWKNA